MIVQIKYKGVHGDQNIIHDIECDDVETCPNSGEPLPINDDAKMEVIFDNIDAFPNHEFVI